MIEFNQALEIVTKAAITMDVEHVRLEKSLNRVLAREVLSDMDMPPFNKSAVDGFACRRADLAHELTIIETIKAGDVPTKTVGENQCSRIMTGGKVPEKADCVVMVEYTQVTGSIMKFTGEKTANNIALKGEDVITGTIVLSPGTIINPQQIAVLAAVGCVEVPVYKKPRIAVLNTGDEIIEPHLTPEGTCIRNSNGSQLVAQIEKAGAIANYMGIVSDNPDATDQAIKKALDGHDLVLLTGGVSMGDFDFVPSVLEKNGVNLIFEKIAIKPGKPTVFGRKGDRFVFGLPGNPVSSFVIFELIVKTFILKMMGHTYQPVPVKIPLSDDFFRKNADRTVWMPVDINQQGQAVLIDYHGSGHIHSLCYAKGLVRMSVGETELKKGELVNVRLI